MVIREKRNNSLRERNNVTADRKSGFRFFCLLAVKCLLVLLPALLIWFYLWKRPLSYVDEESASYICLADFVETESDRYYDVIVLGDSVTNSAFVPEVLSEGTVNLSIGGESPIEQYYTLKKYLNNHDAPKVCYIGFDDYHLYAMQEDVLEKFVTYTDLFSETDIREIYSKAGEADDVEALTDDYKKKLFEDRIRSFKTCLPALLNAGINGRYEVNKETCEDMAIHRGTYTARTVRELSVPKQNEINTFQVGPTFEYYYKRIIELCRDQGIQVRILKYPAAGENYSEKYRKEFQEYYDSLKKEYPGITVDWLEGDFDSTDFVDRHHFNNHGSYRISQLIKSMYPEDFAGSESEDASSETILGLDDYISQENAPDYLLKWVEGRDYSVIFLNQNGTSLQDDSDLREEINEVYSPQTEISSGDVTCTCFAGDGHTISAVKDGDDLTVRDEHWSGSLSVSVKKNVFYLDYTWSDGGTLQSGSQNTDLLAIVVDCDNQKIVAVKDFALERGHYSLLEETEDSVF